MNYKFNKIVAKASAAAMIATSLVSAMPAHAAVTLARDVMSGTAPGDNVQKVSAAGVTHTVTLTHTGDVTGTITLSYPAGFTNFAFVSGSCTGGTIADGGTATNVVDFDITGTCNAGTFTIVFTGDNPGTAGSYPVVTAGDVDLAGTHYAVPITDEDQITVTASVDPYITFDLEASNTVCASGTDGSSTDHTPNAGAYTVALGLISPTAVKSSQNAGTIQHICTTVSTNAADGYSLSVRSENGGLYNGAQYINDQATETADTTMSEVTLSPGTEGYGLCLSTTTVPDMDTTTPAGSNLTGDADFSSGTCDDTSAVVGQLTTTTETIGSNAGPVQESTAQWNVKAAIAATTGAGSYTDTLTFVATGTF